LLLDRVAYIGFRLLVFVFKLLPFGVLYGLSNCLYGLFYVVIGYRKKVVRQNLAHAFPNKSPQERLAIEKKFYRFLFDLLLESIKGLSFSKKELLKRQQHHTPDLPQGIIDKGRSALMVGGHYGNWEWGSLRASSCTEAPVIILYSPIKNRYIDAYLKAARAKFDTQLVSYLEAMKIFREQKDTLSTFVLIADQSPSNPRRAYWLPFLHQDTAVLRGPAIYAQRYNLPLLFLSIQRLKRGYYTMGVEVLTEHPRNYSPEELIGLYWTRLEQLIEEQPEWWLWSHRRWKHSR
jgi:KDO2-lipid IV(A) lauroyltransferase